MTYVYKMFVIVPHFGHLPLVGLCQ